MGVRTQIVSSFKRLANFINNIKNNTNCSGAAAQLPIHSFKWWELWKRFNNYRLLEHVLHM